MLRFITSRLASYAAMVFISTSLVYLLASLTLDPRSNFLTMRPQPSPQAIDAVLDAANVNDKEPILGRYLDWLQGVLLHGDWGTSPMGEPVGAELSHRILVSLQLVSAALVIAIVLGIALGVYTAKRKYRPVDRVASLVSSVFLVTPTFVLALLVILVYLQVHQQTGIGGLAVTGLGTGSLIDYLRHLVLPTVVLVIATYYHFHLTQRTYLLDAINADYVRTARAKGVPRGVAIRRHALRVASVPTAFGVATTVAMAVTGSLFVEVVFAINGVGQYFVESLNDNDINGAVAIAFLTAVATCVGLLLADIVVSILDPRVRLS